MYKPILYPVLSWLLCAFAFAQTPLHYELTLDSPIRGKARVRLHLPTQADKSPFILYSPATEMGLTSQVYNVTCEGKTYLLQKQGVWTVPRACKKVTWDIQLLRGMPNQVDAARQESLYLDGSIWWIIATPTALLKLKGKEKATITVYGPACDKTAETIAKKLYTGILPHDWQAPEFIAIDPCHQHQRQSLIPGLRFVVDNPVRFEKLNLDKHYAPVFAYLTRLTGTHETVISSPITVIWLGRATSLGAIGGAAGHHSFVANYLVGTDAHKIEEEAAHTLMVVTHEQFHQLTSLVRHAALPLPTWINESLAQYYALKALRTHARFTPHTMAKLEKPFLSALPAENISLLEAEKRYKKERQLYSLFYTKGSAFWHQVDQLIHAATGDNLDHYLPHILQTEFVGEGGRREDWEKAFKKQLPAETIDRILQAI